MERPGGGRHSGGASSLRWAQQCRPRSSGGADTGTTPTPRGPQQMGQEDVEGGEEEEGTEEGTGMRSRYGYGTCYVL